MGTAEELREDRVQKIIRQEAREEGRSELGSGLRLGEESVVGWRQRHEREKSRQKGRSFKSKSPRSMAASARAALSS